MGTRGQRAQDTYLERHGRGSGVVVGGTRELVDVMLLTGSLWAFIAVTVFKSIGVYCGLDGQRQGV